MVEEGRAEGAVGDGHLAVAVAEEEGELPRGGHRLGGGGEVSEGERGEGEVREGGAEDEPGDDEDDAEDNGEADHGGDEGPEEGARRGVTVVVGLGVVVLGLRTVRWGSGVGVCGGGWGWWLAAVGVVEGWGWVARGGSRRFLLHSWKGE